MRLEFALTDEPTNTRFAPLAALGAYYHAQDTLAPLLQVSVALKTVHYRPADKLEEVLVSMLAGCTHIAQINTRLRPETALAWAWGRDGYVEQSTVARTLDALTQTNLQDLRAAGTAIWRAHSQALHHDWRGWLWFDLDLSGLRASPQAEDSTKGYFSGEKTPPGGSSRGCPRWITRRPSGPHSIQATAIVRTASNPRCSRWKVCLSSPPLSGGGWLGGWMAASAATRTWRGCWPGTTKC